MAVCVLKIVCQILQVRVLPDDDFDAVGFLQHGRADVFFGRYDQKINAGNVTVVRAVAFHMHGPAARFKGAREGGKVLLRRFSARDNHVAAGETLQLTDNFFVRHFPAGAEGVFRVAESTAHGAAGQAQKHRRHARVRPFALQGIKNFIYLQTRLRHFRSPTVPGF